MYVCMSHDEEGPIHLTNVRSSTHLVDIAVISQSFILQQQLH